MTLVRTPWWSKFLPGPKGLYFVPKERWLTSGSIIAIEGLGTNPFGTFRSPEGDGMWLRDFLPDVFPDSRILLYGYDSKVPGSKSSQSVPEIAGTCKNFVMNFRELTEVLFLDCCDTGFRRSRY